MKEELTQRACEVRDETLPQANTAHRIGTLLQDVIEFADAFTTQKATANGLATLNGEGRIPIGQIPIGTTAATVAAGEHTHANIMAADPLIPESKLNATPNIAGKLTGCTSVPAGCSNAPVISFGAAGYTVQMVAETAGKGVYLRRCNAFSWGEWTPVWTQGSLPATVTDGVLYVKDIVATGN